MNFQRAEVRELEVFFFPMCSHPFFLHVLPDIVQQSLHAFKVSPNLNNLGTEL